ncbi:MAG: response regulator, partial [Planctomycetes bacterium]|nr:response regulator [Planctomycetota bacterium]
MAYLLIIEDDEDFANATATVFKNAGHEVRVEYDTTTALATIKEKHPDIVLLDVMF